MLYILQDLRIKLYFVQKLLRDLDKREMLIENTKTTTIL